MSTSAKHLSVFPPVPKDGTLRVAKVNKLLSLIAKVNLLIFCRYFIINIKNANTFSRVSKHFGYTKEISRVWKSLEEKVIY